MPSPWAQLDIELISCYGAIDTIRDNRMVQTSDPTLVLVFGNISSSCGLHKQALKQVESGIRFIPPERRKDVEVILRQVSAIKSQLRKLQDKLESHTSGTCGTTWGKITGQSGLQRCYRELNDRGGREPGGRSGGGFEIDGTRESA